MTQEILKSDVKMIKQKILVWLPFEMVITSLHNLVIKAASMEAFQRDMNLVVSCFKKSEEYRYQTELEEFPFETQDYFSLLSAIKEIKPAIIYCESLGNQFTLELTNNPNVRVVEPRTEAEEVAKELYQEYLNKEQYVTHSIAEKLHETEDDAELAYENLYEEYYSWDL